MAQLVRYNGKTASYYGCTDPDELVVGKVYEVIRKNVRKWQTDYILEGVEGHFNSCWFDDVLPLPESAYPAISSDAKSSHANTSGAESQRPTFMAVAKEIPCLGERCNLSRLEITNGQLTQHSCYTSIVTDIIPAGNSIYMIATCNSNYIVLVG